MEVTTERAVGEGGGALGRNGPSCDPSDVGDSSEEDEDMDEREPTLA